MNNFPHILQTVYQLFECLYIILQRFLVVEWTEEIRPFCHRFVQEIDFLVIEVLFLHKRIM